MPNENGVWSSVGSSTNWFDSNHRWTDHRRLYLRRSNADRSRISRKEHTPCWNVLRMFQQNKERKVHVSFTMTNQLTLYALTCASRSRSCALGFAWRRLFLGSSMPMHGRYFPKNLLWKEQPTVTTISSWCQPHLKSTAKALQGGFQEWLKFNFPHKSHA